jgi:hypothetical protein
VSYRLHCVFLGLHVVTDDLSLRRARWRVVLGKSARSVAVSSHHVSRSPDSERTGEGNVDVHRQSASILGQLARSSDPEPSSDRVASATSTPGSSYRLVDGAAEARKAIAAGYERARAAEQRRRRWRWLAGPVSRVRSVQDLSRVWDVASPERRRQLVWTMLEAVKVRDCRITAIRPRPELLPLFALLVRNSGPDRIRTGDLVLDRDVC